MTHRSKLFASSCPTAAAGCAIAAATGVSSVTAPALSNVRRAGEIGSSIVSLPSVRMSTLPSRPTVGSHQAFPPRWGLVYGFHQQLSAIERYCLQAKAWIVDMVKTANRQSMVARFQ